MTRLHTLLKALHTKVTAPLPHREGQGGGSSLFLISYFLFLISCLTSCYPTSNLPEDEVLYTGISEIAYNRKARARGEKRQQSDSTGVITSLAEAYHTVEGVLSGQADTRVLLQRLMERDSTLTIGQLDTIRREMSIVDKAMVTTSEEVEAALAYAPNGSIFGSSTSRWPFSAGLCFYNAFVRDSSAFGQWLFNSFATQPRTISMANPRLRTQVAQQTLRNYGFFRGRVDFDVQPHPHDSLKARIGYSVFPGPLFRFGKIEYQHFASIQDSLIRCYLDESLIHEGDAFTVPSLDGERKRLSTLLRNNGFYYFRPDYIGFRADTLQVPMRAQLQVRPKPETPALAGRRFYMGKTNVTVLKYDDFAITDSTILRDGSLMRWSGGDKQTPLRYGALRHNMLYRRRDLYRQDVHDTMSEKLAAMGIFSSLQVNYTPRDTSATCDTLDVHVFAVLDKPWDSELEAKVTNKSNGLLGPGLSWGVTRRNAFRGAEALNFKLRGSYEWQTGATATGQGDRSLLNSYELGASVSLTYPRIKFFGSPFARKLNRRAQGTTHYQLDVDWMNRSSYFQMVSFSGRLSYTYQRHRRVRNEFTPLRLDYNMLTHRSARFDSVMTANPALYISMRDQFVPSMSYGLTYTFNPHPDTQCSFIFNIKEAGNALNMLYVLGGRGIKERNKQLLGAPFAEYLKCSFEWRETFRAGYHAKIAARALAGAIWSYGNSTMAPYADLFSIGGANSIRAFGIRTIGPGRYRPAGSSWSYVDQVGNIKFEANVEYRFPLMAGSLEGALFLDAGNVWLMQPDDSRPGAAIDASHFFNDLALGTGFGFRYDLDFLVLRFDIGVGIHAPYDTGKSSYYNMKRLWDSLGFHIAVGYPF